MMSTGSRRGGVLFGLLISAIVLVCLTAAAGLWFAHNFSVQSTEGRNGDNVSIRTPVGDLSIRTHSGDVDPEAFGVPVYPGARKKKRGDHGGGAVFEWTSRDGTTDKGFSVQGVELVTDDPAEKVLAFYRGRLPNWIVEKEKNHMLRLELSDGGYKRNIAITEQSDGTHIGIATAGVPPAN